MLLVFFFFFFYYYWGQVQRSWKYLKWFYPREKGLFEVKVFFSQPVCTIDMVLNFIIWKFRITCTLLPGEICQNNYYYIWKCYKEVTDLITPGCFGIRVIITMDKNFLNFNDGKIWNLLTDKLKLEKKEWMGNDKMNEWLLRTE